ncbi:aldehyde dehydrogenase family protein [Chryseobacterium rhizosphaerae]|uniref:Aldehyde dehydrogenase n=1 Tax=Chryseobacterium rhizosphaerae TaxID=395937 RepID=A0ABX9IED5_9FLAO|nr:aldehyde dehydrogenase family protein [Chryseobacterium rhizosphaerae]REC70471.1 aldehyde dehydrogenase family protein [Chryseobacterium rhizosphaerae]GEN67665.1 aldehyde dehydrogenase [Chryseobacterium rhizosphaerae]
MIQINKIYINGEFVSPQGTDTFDLIDPTTNRKTGEVILGNEEDTKAAIAAAREAFKTFSKTTKAERIVLLKKLHEAVSKREEELVSTMVKEYGGSLQFCKMSVQNAISAFTTTIEILESFDFERTAGHSKVRFEPLGVVGIITPWNASNSFICNKLATAIAAGCTAVIKPSEMSAQQTQLIAECFHEAGLPKGVFNMVNGLGNVVGTEITNHSDIAKISFTGSTITGKTIAKGAVDTMKRVTLELGGKSPNIILEDADLDKAVPMAVFGAYMNNGQACIAPTRLLVPQNKLNEVNELAKQAVRNVKVGQPNEEDTTVGPMVSAKQYERVQTYIRLGQSEGATLLAGGEGKPEGLEDGHFVKATIFTNVRNDMRIAREEIFGPVLSIIPYQNEEEAIKIANDTPYGLAAYISSSSKEHAEHVAAQIDAGRICINGFAHDPLAPFGGFKQSGIGREYGVFGLEAYLEPKAILA